MLFHRMTRNNLALGMTGIYIPFLMFYISKGEKDKEE